MNILQINIDGINTKIQTHSLYNTAYLVNEHTIHIAMIQESKLKGHSITPSIGDNSTEIRNDRKVSDGGGLITYIHENISYIDTTKNTRAQLLQQDKTIELKSFKISTGLNKHIILINIYIPTKESIPNGYLPPLHQVSQMPNLIIGGDFNYH